MPSKKEFVLSVVLSRDLEHTLLLDKLRGPAGVKGRANFLGGAVEAGETYAQAASREFVEESGLVIEVGAWQTVGIKEFPDALVAVMVATSPDLKHARSCTDEPVRVMHVDDVMLEAAEFPQRFVVDVPELLVLAKRRLQESMAFVDPDHGVTLDEVLPRRVPKG